MNRIQNYFNLLVKRIAVDAEIAASSSSHKADIGDNREIIVQKFLEKHLPKRLNSSFGGEIIGSDGSESKQIDIIISSDIAVRFEENNKTFITTEGVAAAITVKSFLDKAALEDCLLNLDSIPQADPNVLKFPFTPVNLFISYIKSRPSLFVFAYKGIRAQTCVEYLRSFYQEHNDIPVNRYPLAVIVLDKDYMITYCESETETIGGEYIPAGTFWPAEGLFGFPLAFMLYHISTYTSLLPHMLVNSQPYFNCAYGTANS